jgi:hypothetical protein
VCMDKYTNRYELWTMTTLTRFRCQADYKYV